MKLKFLGLLSFYFVSLNGAGLQEPKLGCCKQLALYSCIGCCKTAKYACLCCGICYWALVTGITQDFAPFTDRAIGAAKVTDNVENHIKEQFGPRQQKLK